MTEQAVKDAAAAFADAKGKLDKAVNDTKDEIAKASDVIASAVPVSLPKAVGDSSEPLPLNPSAQKAPPSAQLQAAATGSAPAPKSSNAVRNAVLGALFAAAAYLAALHFHLIK